MTTYPPPNPPVIGGHPKRHSGTGNHPITRVVIHSAVMECRPGAARTLADWNRRGTTGGSWHYSTDPREAIQCSFDRYVCHHAPPNDGSAGIEMADWPARRPGESRIRRRLRKSWRWRTRNHRDMLKITARLTAELCLANDLPLRFVGARGLRRGRKGWTTHAAVSKAWGQSSHWDPGWWPRRRFGRLVRQAAAEIRQEHGQ